MGKAERKAKNQEQAARMKREGVERRTTNCVMCHKEVSLGNYPNHILSCRTGNPPRTK